MKESVNKTPELLSSICERLASGESLRDICKSDGMPTETAVRKWAIKDPHGFGSQYAISRNMAMDAMEDDLLEIADAELPRLDNGATDSGAVNNKRVRIDTRKWIMSKIAPKRYGDKQSIELTGKDEGPLLVEHKASAIAVLLEKAAQRKTQSDDVDALA